jgi:hypothetical protein
VVVDRLHRDEEPLGDRAVAKAGGDEPEHLQLALRQPGGVAAGRGARATRKTAHTPLAEPPGDDPCRRRGAELLERGQALQRLLPFARRARQRGLVRAACARPERGRTLPVAGELERVRLRNRERKPVVQPRPGAPQRELAGEPGIAPADRELEDVVGQRAHLVEATFEPGGLGPGRGHRLEPEQLRGRLRKGGGLVEERPRVGVAAPGAHACDHGERDDPGHGRVRPDTQHRIRRVHGGRPPTLVELGPCAGRERVWPEELEPVVLAVRQRLPESRVGFRERPPQHQPVDVVERHPARRLDEVVHARDLERALDLVAPRRQVQELLRRSEAPERDDEQLLVSDALRELERPIAPDGRLAELARVPAEKRLRGVGVPEVRIGLELLEELDCLATRRQRLGDPPGTPEVVGEDTQRVPRGPRVAELRVATERHLERSDRLGAVVGEIAGVGAPLEKTCPLGSREAVAEAQRPVVVVGRLAVRARGRGALGCGGREAKHGFDVAGSFRMQRESPGVRRAGERLERAAVEVRSPVRRKRILDRQARQVVPEVDVRPVGLQHSAHEALLEAPDRVGRQRVEQGHLG